MYTITHPTSTVDIVTDLQALNEAGQIAAQLQSVKDHPMQGLTEAEEGKARKQSQQLKSQLKELLDTIDRSTLHVTLEGMGASAWTQTVLEATDRKTAAAAGARDLHKLIRIALPQMVTTITTADGTKIPEQDAEPTILSLLDTITDTQEGELLTTIQTLNTPTVSVPKSMRELAE